MTDTPTPPSAPFAFPGHDGGAFAPVRAAS